MIVKILSGSKSFSAVKYNTDKISRQTGELMVARNFGILDGLSSLRPQDYKNYLQAVSSANPNISKPQFHAAISASGRSADKHELTTIAEDWLNMMGYTNQPYLIIFHNDTANNHVHIVSTRVDKTGKKISSAFEKVRAIKNIERAVGLKTGQQVKDAISLALSYQITTKAQFMLLLEQRGYDLKEENNNLLVFREAIHCGQVPLEQVQDKIEEETKNRERLRVIKALFYKYAAVHDTALEKSTSSPSGNGVYNKNKNVFTSDFARHALKALGIELLFHAKGDKPPYGYTVIDHKGKNVFKGSEVLPLNVLIGLYRNSAGAEIEDTRQNSPGRYEPTIDVATPDYSVYNPVPIEGLADTGFEESAQLSISIADDVDDEAIHGRNRRKKRKARTNSR